MQDIYETYYWQNDKVRLRMGLPMDGDNAFYDDLDFKAWSLVHEELVLPPVKRIVDLSGVPAEPNVQEPAFSIENLYGEFVGHIHFNYIN